MSETSPWARRRSTPNGGSLRDTRSTWRLSGANRTSASTNRHEPVAPSISWVSSSTSSRSSSQASWRASATSVAAAWPRCCASASSRGSTAVAIGVARSSGSARPGAGGPRRRRPRTCRGGGPSRRPCTRRCSGVRADARGEGALAEPGPRDDDRQPAVGAGGEPCLELGAVEGAVGIARRDELGRPADAHRRGACRGRGRGAPVVGSPLRHSPRMVAAQPGPARTTFVVTGRRLVSRRRAVRRRGAASGCRTGRGRGSGSRARRRGR